MTRLHAGWRPGSQLGPQLGMRFVHVQQLGFATLDVVDTAPQLGTPSRIDLVLGDVRVLAIQASQTTMDDGGTIMLTKGEKCLLNLCSAFGHASSVRRAADTTRVTGWTSPGAPLLRRCARKGAGGRNTPPGGTAPA